MDKFQLIQQLENKLVPIPSGEHKPVRNSKLVTDYGEFSLLRYEAGQLEVMLKYAKDGE